MPCVPDSQGGLRREVAKTNLDRLAKSGLPTGPKPNPDTIPQELHKAQIGALLATATQVHPTARPRTAQARVLTWLATLLATWLGALAALLGAPQHLNFDLVLSLLLKWSKDNEGNILTAQTQQVSGGKGAIHWQSCFLLSWRA